ncbi:hypothetical protein P7K49_031499, partial [Saguinus oedipus]
MRVKREVTLQSGKTKGSDPCPDKEKREEADETGEPSQTISFHTTSLPVSIQEKEIWKARYLTFL